MVAGKSHSEPTFGRYALWGRMGEGKRQLIQALALILILARPLSSVAALDQLKFQEVTPAPTQAMLRAVVFGAGRFVAVGDNGLVLTSSDAVSSDGEDWIIFSLNLALNQRHAGFIARCRL
jgi:hypothetical protein